MIDLADDSSIPKVLGPCSVRLGSLQRGEPGTEGAIFNHDQSPDSCAPSLHVKTDKKHPVTPSKWRNLLRMRLL